MNQRNVLVVDDEPHMRRVLEIMLVKAGHVVFSAENGIDALAILNDRQIDLVITDVRMPGMSGLELLASLRASGNNVPVIVITAHGSVESAVEAMKFGASDYIQRPFDIDALELIIARLLNEVEVIRQNIFLREELNRGWDTFIGVSTAMQDVYAQIRQVAPSRVSVLISGETGTGKELAARAIHHASERADKLFVPINCAAIPSDMLEAELFGYEKGAFTGAAKDRTGKFELANGGTVFLDEITEMPPGLQVKLLRFLQDNRLDRLGSNRQIQLDIRVIAATNRNPRKAISDGLLREDLFYRLNVFPINLPPLRDRKEDIHDLAQHFIAKHSARAKDAITDAIVNKLQAYDWPGNVRELENMVERALILAGHASLKAEHFPIDVAVNLTPRDTLPEAACAAPVVTGPLVQAVETYEAKLISQALAQVQGNKPKAAALLEISERTLWYKMKKYFPKETE